MLQKLSLHHKARVLRLNIKVLHKNSPKRATISNRPSKGLSELSTRRLPASPGEELAGGADPVEDPVDDAPGGCVVDGIEDEDEDEDGP